MNPNSEPQNPFASGSQMATVGQLANEEQMNFIRKTYVLFLAGVLCCIVMGAATLMVEPLFMASISVLRSPLLAIGVILGGSILAQNLAQRPGLDIAALFGFTGLMGFVMSPIVAYYGRDGHNVVGQAAVMSVVVFGSLTAYVFVTKKDFSFLGGMLCVGMISLIVGMLLNAFWLKSPMTSYFLSWGVLFMSSGFVLYKTSNLINNYQTNQAGAAALGLFVSFLNIFMSLLRILGGRR